MKKFISQITIFTAILAVVVIGSTAGTYFIQSKASFKLPPDRHILVLGDSHTECAINDNIYSRAENVAQSSAIYLYSYCKLKKFLNENQHIDTVLLSFHYPTLTSRGYERWENRFTFQKIPSYFTLLSREDIDVFSNKKMRLLKFIFQPPDMIVLKFIVKGGRISYKDLHIGGHNKLDNKKLQKDIARWQKEEKRTEADSISFYQKEYLLKIADFCKSRNVELILINTPTYKPEIYDDNDKLEDFRNTCLPEVTYWDYSAFPLPDGCYDDIGHLNYKGAEIFSKYLQENPGIGAKTTK